MEPLFDIYLTGHCTADAERPAVVDGLARLFNLEPNRAEGLLDGQLRRVKRHCDKATALRYRAALHELGAQVSLTRLDTLEQNESPDTSSSPATDASESFSLAPAGTRLSDPAPPPSQVVAIPSYSVAPPGEIIPSLASHTTPVSPSIDHLELCDLDSH